MAEIPRSMIINSIQSTTVSMAETLSTSALAVPATTVTKISALKIFIAFGISMLVLALLFIVWCAIFFKKYKPHREINRRCELFKKKCWIQPLVQEESFELNHLKGKKTFKSVIYNENTSEAVNFSCPMTEPQVIQANNVSGYEKSSFQSVDNTVLAEESFLKKENLKSTPLCSSKNPFSEDRLEIGENKKRNQEDSFSSLELNTTDPSTEQQKKTTIRKSSRLITKNN